MPFCDEYWAFIIVSVMFGAFLSAWCAVTSPAIVEMCGLELLTSGFGTLTFVRGFAALIGKYFHYICLQSCCLALACKDIDLTLKLNISSLGPPIAGWLVDKSGNEEYAFYLSAALLFSSAVICVAAWIAQKTMERKRNTASTIH